MNISEIGLAFMKANKETRADRIKILHPKRRAMKKITITITDVEAKLILSTIRQRKLRRLSDKSMAILDRMEGEIKDKL
jgi:hypothetical protein